MAMHIKAAIIKTSLEKSKEKGTLSVCLWLRLIPNDKDGFLPAGVEEAQYAHLYLTDRTIDRTCNTLRELGWQGAEWEELHYGNPLDGVECSITGDFEEYNGKSRFKIQWVNAGGQVRDIGEFSKEFKAWNKHIADGAKTPLPQSNESPETSTQEDENLPF
jgi:hypothetical protein